MVNSAPRRSLVRFLIGTTIGATGSAFNAVHWMHRTRPDAPVQVRIWLVLCVLSVVSALLRFLYYRNRRNYFAEEMEHRRSLAKGTAGTRG
jgi:hypothetical protein